MPIDLKTGRSTTAPREDVESTARPVRAKTSSSSSGSGARKTTREKAEDDVTERIEDVLTRIAEGLANRGEQWNEFSSALRQDAHKMGASIVSLTRRITVLRGPLLWVLTMVEPVLAFSRIVRLGFAQFRVWRQARFEDQAIDVDVNDNGSVGTG
jgi:histone H3/H4